MKRRRTCPYCGYSWRARVPSPGRCPGCRRRLASRWSFVKLICGHVVKTNHLGNPEALYCGRCRRPMEVEHEQIII